MALRVARSFFRTSIYATPMRRIVAACVWAGAIAGCTIDPLNNDLLTASIAPGTARKSICVIAAIGDTFSLQKVGVTAFGNALDKVSLEAWGIDKFVGDKVSSQLAQRFDARRLDYPRGAFAFIERTRSPFSGDGKDFREEIRDAAAASSHPSAAICASSSRSRGARTAVPISRCTGWASSTTAT